MKRTMNVVRDRVHILVGFCNAASQ